MSDNIIATSLVIDSSDQGTIFPSAGGNSSDPRVQAVYWRCAAVMLSSARLSNPGTRLAFFSNVTPPTIDDIDLAETFERLGVEIHRVEAVSRPAMGRTQTFGNVLYFIDILDHLAARERDVSLALLDCDVVVTRPIAPLFDALLSNDFAGYRLDTVADEDINGMTRLDLTSIASRLLEEDVAEPLAHYGGELLGARLDGWREHRELFAKMLKQAQSGDGPASGVTTEEHMFSIAFARTDIDVFDANPLIKRIWTSPRHSTVEHGDELLALWHLPAEKRYGLQDLFRELAACDFGKDLSLAEFREKAGRTCGVPRKSAHKTFHDGIRQVAAKIGLKQ